MSLMRNAPFEAVPSSSSEIVNSFRSFSRRVSIVAIVIGVVVLLGWLLDIDSLKSIIPGRVTQKPNTAFGMIASGVTLAMWHWQSALPAGRFTKRVRRGLLLLPGFVVVLGMVTLIEYGFGLDFGISQLLFKESPDAVDAIAGGRLAPNTAINFLLMGSALLLLIQHRYRAAQGVSVAAFFWALLALTGHLYTVTDFYRVGSVTGMAIHTAIAFLLLSLGVLFARADQGWMREVSSGYYGSIMIRRLLPMVIVLPILLGALVLLIYAHWALFPEGAIALRSILSIMIFSAIIWWNGRSLNRIDAQRLEMQQRFNQELEAQIATRTAECNIANQDLQQAIDKLQQTDAKLRNNRVELQRQLVEIETIYRSAPIGLNMLDPDLRFVRINERLAEINGFSVEEHIGRTVRELLPDLADTAEQLLRPIFETGEPLLDVEIRGETPAQPGVQRTWLESFLPLKEGDRVIGISTVCEEITERRRNEQVLAERAAQQAEIARIGQQALVTQNIQSFLDAVVTQVAQILDVEYCKVLERLPDDSGLLLRSGVGWQEELVGHAVITNDRKSQASYALLSQEPVVVEDLHTETRFVGSPLLTQHGVVSGASIIIGNTGNYPYGVLEVHTRSRRSFTENDVNFLQAIANILSETISRHEKEQEIRQINASLERRVEERTQQLVEVNQELEAFAYSISHDLRAPLRAIEGLARIFQEDYSDRLDATGLDYTQMLIESATQLDYLIQDLLAYSRLGRRDIQLTSVSLAVMAQKVVNDLDTEIKRREPNIVVEPLPVVLAQHSVLRQVITNLLTNAVKFVALNKTPTVRIWAENRDQWARIWVEDNGIGIAPRHQERIFRPFERLHGVEAYPGTGIGLAIVQRGVARMGGHVGVESTLGEGSRFWFELSRA